MIEWILFDQAGVQTKSLFTNKEEYEINGKIFPAKLLESIFDTKNYELYSVGKLNEKELIVSFLKENNISLSVEEYKKILLSTVTPIEGMPGLLSELKKKYKLASLINEGAEWANHKLDVPDLRKYFDKLIVSGDIGLAKPDISFYKKALSIIKAKPEECIFIDDKAANCAGAEKIGIKAVVFKDTAQLKSELSKYGINLC